MSKTLKRTADPLKDLTGHQRLAQAILPQFQDMSFTPAYGDPLFYAPCAVAGCLNERYSVRGLCNAHEERRRRLGHAGTPEAIVAFLQDPALHTGPKNKPPVYRFDGLPTTLANELRLVLQTRQERGHPRVRAARMEYARQCLIRSGIQSIFDDVPITPEDILIQGTLPPIPPWASQRDNDISGLWRDMMRAAAPYYAQVPILQRNLWYPRDFGLKARYEKEDRLCISFVHYQQQWVIQWCKRYAEYHIKIGRQKWSSIAGQVSHLRYFDTFVTEQHPDWKGPSDITRKGLEDYLLWIRTSSRAAPSIQSGIVCKLRTLLEADRELGWTPGLGRGTVLRLGEAPRSPDPVPHPISPFILAQLFSEAALNRIDEVLRSALTIVRHHGLRVSSLIMLKFDCLEYTDQGPVLNYHNVKSNRPTQQPILKQAVLDAIESQQAWVRSKFPQGSPWLFPSERNNPSGARYSRAMILPRRLNKVLDRLDVRDHRGERVYLTWGQFRDTVATELLNRDPHPVPPAIVAAWLDHSDTRSLDHYC